MAIKNYKQKILQSLLYGSISMTPILLFGILDVLFGETSIHHTKSESLRFLIYLYLFVSILISLAVYYYQYQFAPKKIKKVLNHKAFQKLNFTKNENSLIGLHRDFHCQIFYESFAQNPMIKGSALSILLPFEVNKLTLDAMSLQNNKLQYVWYKDAVLLSLSADFSTPAEKLLIQLDTLIEILNRNKLKTTKLAKTL